LHHGLLAGTLALVRLLLRGKTKIVGDADTIFVVAKKVSGVSDRYPPFLYY
jgi:hypothetical protein